MSSWTGSSSGGSWGLLLRLSLCCRGTVGSVSGRSPRCAIRRALRPRTQVNNMMGDVEGGVGDCHMAERGRSLHQKAAMILCVCVGGGALTCAVA